MSQQHSINNMCDMIIKAEGFRQINKEGWGGARLARPLACGAIQIRSSKLKTHSKILNFEEICDVDLDFFL